MQIEVSNKPQAVTLDELIRLLDQKRMENPEAARLRDRMAQLYLRLSILGAMQFDGWLAQSLAAMWFNVHPGTISRLVKAGKIITNGLSGSKCLVNPASVAEYYGAQEDRKMKRLDRRNEIKPLRAQLR